MYYVNVGDFIEIEVSKNPLRIEKGILRDINWKFLWGKDLPQNLLLRIVFSKLYEEFVREWEKAGLSFEEFKTLLTNFDNEEQINSLLYVLSGDNMMWLWGELFISVEERVWEELTEMFSEEEVDKVWDEVETRWNCLELLDKETKEEWLERFIVDAVKSSANWKKLKEKVEALSEEIIEEVLQKYEEELKEAIVKELAG